MANSVGGTFFSAFLDGFTCAGLVKHLVVPGEPVIGFAPSPDVYRTDLRSLARLEEFAEIRIDGAKQLIRQIKLNTGSGKFVIGLESSSGEAVEFELESETEALRRELADRSTHVS